jgi:hypothetical protein
MILRKTLIKIKTIHELPPSWQQLAIEKCSFAEKMMGLCVAVSQASFCSAKLRWLGVRMFCLKLRILWTRL